CICLPSPSVTNCERNGYRARLGSGNTPVAIRTLLLAAMRCRRARPETAETRHLRPPRRLCYPRNRSIVRQVNEIGEPPPHGALTATTQTRHNRGILPGAMAGVATPHLLHARSGTTSWTFYA